MEQVAKTEKLQRAHRSGRDRKAALNRSHCDHSSYFGARSEEREIGNTKANQKPIGNNRIFVD